MSQCACGQCKREVIVPIQGEVNTEVWKQLSGMVTTDVVISLARLEARVELLENTVSSNTWLDARVETLEQTIKDMEADS